MKEKRNVLRGPWITFLCCALLPGAAMGLGAFVLMRGVQFNLRFVVTYIVIPAVGLGLLAWCMLSRCRTWVKGILCGGVLVVFAAAFLFSFFFMGFVLVRHYEGAEVKEQYSSVREEFPLLPELPSLAETECYHVSNAFGVFFISETDYLICTYTQEEYEIQKARLDTKYSFQAEPITLYDETCEPMIERDGYVFRMLSFDAYEGMLYYPKKIILIGYSDQSREIVYGAFDDGELDYISSLEDFITEECGWKYIR